MKTLTSFSLLAALTAAGLTSGARAQTSSSATATPSTEISATTPLPTPNEIVYVPRLPTPSDITKGAQAKSVSVERISQTNAQVDVVYRTADGKVDTTSYRLLADAGTSGGPVPASSSGVAVPSSPAPAVAIAGTTTPTTVVYQPAPATRVYYYPDYYADYPGYWYPPVSFGIGFGYRSYGYYGGYRGGYRVGYRGGFHGGGFHGGGWHR